MFVSPAVFMIEQFANPSENLLRRLAGNLLRNDVLDDRRKEIWLDRPADASDPVDNLSKPPISRLEILHLLLAVFEVHLLPRDLSQFLFSFYCGISRVLVISYGADRFVVVVPYYSHSTYSLP